MSNELSSCTINLIQAVTPFVKDSICAITKTIVGICANEIECQNAQVDGDSPFTVEEAQSVLDYIHDMARERSVRTPNISVDFGINIIEEFLVLSHDVKADLAQHKLDANRCKHLIRTGHVILNYFDDVLKRTA